MPTVPLPMDCGLKLFKRHLISSKLFQDLGEEERNLRLKERWEKLTENEKCEYNREADKV